jgi:hypothetical protein
MKKRLSKKELKQRLKQELNCIKYYNENFFSGLTFLIEKTKKYYHIK